MESEKNLIPEKDFIKVQDEVFRKIGRNLLIFQKIEVMLKYLIDNGKVSGYLRELKENQERRISPVDKQMTRNLAGQFMDAAFHEHEESLRDPLVAKEPYISFSFTVRADSDFYESKRQSLKSLVDDRNNFIQHLLPRFNPDSMESCLEIGQYLDQQREKLVPEHNYLKSLIESFEEAKKAYIEYFDSEEGKRQFDLSLLQQSPLITLLLNVSIHQSRFDGWTLLNVAGQRVRQILPGEMEQLKSKWGYKSLKELVLASELFEVIEEPTEKGGIRVLYRPKSEPTSDSAAV
jgi:hypothetical protein